MKALIRKTSLFMLCLFMLFSSFPPTTVNAAETDTAADEYYFSWRIINSERAKRGAIYHNENCHYFDLENEIYVDLKIKHGRYGRATKYEYTVYRIEETPSGIYNVYDMDGNESDFHFCFKRQLLLKVLQPCNSDGTPLLGISTGVNLSQKDNPIVSLKSCGFYRKYPSPKELREQLTQNAKQTS